MNNGLSKLLFFIFIFFLGLTQCMGLYLQQEKDQDILANQISPIIQAVHIDETPKIDGEILSDKFDSWIPILNSDWENNSHSVTARFEIKWNVEGLYIAAVLPKADPAITTPTGRTPDAPFELILNIDRRSEPKAGEPGRYDLKFVPLITEPSKMIYRNQAFQFNHRFGANSILTDPGLVIWKELSLSGIEPEGLETRWSHLGESKDSGMSIEILIPWKNIGMRGITSGDSFYFDMKVNFPGQARNSWTGNITTGHEAGGEIRLLGKNENYEKEPHNDGSLLIHTKGGIITDIESVPVVFPASVQSTGGFTASLTDETGKEVRKANSLKEAEPGIFQGEISASGLDDGRYLLQVKYEETDEIIGSRSVFLAENLITGELSDQREKLYNRLDSLRQTFEQLDWRKGHLARAEYALEISEKEIDNEAELNETKEMLELTVDILDAVSENRRPNTSDEGYLHPAGFAADGRRGTVTFIPSDNETAQLTINADNTEKWEVNPLIYGTFSEPVIFDRPIYDLLYAQRLRNPSFEWGHPTFRTTMNRYTNIYNEIDTEAAEQIREGEWVPVLTTDEDEVAAPWFGIGRGNISFELHDKAYNTKKSQKIVFRGNSGFAGVAQITDLPVWREQNYQFETWLRTDDSPGSAIVKLYHDGKVVDQQHFIDISAEWKSFSAELAAPQSKERQNAFLVSIELEEKGNLYIDQTMLYPADHINGMDPQVVKQTRNLNTGWIRWPGGNLASAYNWEKGVGPLSERKSTINPSWIGLTPHLFGTDEYLHFSRLTNTEPLITVNAGNGTPEEAANWVEYTNGSTETPMGKLRAENGHSNPYNVKYWNIGNELWGHWQDGYCTPVEYVERYKNFTREINKVDSSLKYLAVGVGPFSIGSPVWTDMLLKEVGEDLDILDFHTYVRVPNVTHLSEKERVEALITVPAAYEKGLMEYRGKTLDMQLEDVKVAVGEYNSNTRNIDPKWKETADLLSYAGWLHGFIRQSEYVMGANATEYSLFDPRSGVFDTMHPRYELFRIYREFAGSVPVEAKLESPVRQNPYRLAKDITPVFNLSQIDVVVLKDAEDGSLGIGLMNRNLDNEITIEIDLQDFSPRDYAIRYLFVDENLKDYENSVSVTQETLDLTEDFTVNLPARSVSLIRLQEK